MATPSQAAAVAKATARLAVQAPQDDDVQGFAKGADGKAVVFVNAKTEAKALAKLEAKTKTLVDDADAKVILLDGLPSARAADPATVVGGGGYISDSTATVEGAAGLCSIGFSALSATFTPQAVSAGHCTNESADPKDPESPGVSGKRMNIFASQPSNDDAVHGKTANSHTPALLQGGYTGTVSKYQFGAVGQTEPDTTDTGVIGAGGKENTDYSIIDLKAGAKSSNVVTKWDAAGAAADDLLSSTWKVNGVAVAKAGEKIHRSGRTTGTTDGNVRENTAEITATGGWMNIEGRRVYGFMSTAHSDHGDSGGAYIDADNNAVGVLSGGGNLRKADGSEGPEFSWTTDLENALDQAGNKTRINVAKTPAQGAKTAAKAAATTIEPGGTVSGTGATGFTGGTFVEDGKTTEVAVDGDAWSFKGSETEDDHTGTLYLTSKYTVSEPLEVTYTVKKKEEPAPSQTATGAPTTPAPSQTATEDPTTPAPTQTTSGTPSSPAPTSSNPADPEPSTLQIDPRRIALSKFVGDGDKDKSVGVEASVMGAEPGTKVSFSIKKKGVTAKKETVTADESGNATTRVWGLTSAQNKDVYLGTYGVTADFTEAEQPNAGGTVGKAAAQDAKAGGAKTLESTFSVVSDDAPDPGDDGNDDDNNGSNDDNDNGHLPRTGATVGIALGTAAGLLALGAGMVLMARRRRG
ncbi:LPXTG cell wall anchor domain-containing protein [Brevibacterium sp. BRM-1]|uniref:LPXTG cell wall anchor domain-containing protein n=1 Tax=Brevibacterium sp. BRM-1 TaxID=2999062 RepID=UPI0022803D2E|nr:LPXTG cell wall anchor domain-containing protein [Brevibacterium sp. BRM-1]WAL39115.1 LPXTG cell wall anchor domain-containing protein [Brevibacterium sp. BRM-1]